MGEVVATCKQWTMKTVLILTVGGSHQPIVQSIRQNKPDLVHFLCSDDTERGPGSYTQVIGPGNVLSSKVPGPEPPDLPNTREMSCRGMAGDPAGEPEAGSVKGYSCPLEGKGRAR